MKMASEVPSPKSTQNLKIIHQLAYLNDNNNIEWALQTIYSKNLYSGLANAITTDKKLNQNIKRALLRQII